MAFDLKIQFAGLFLYVRHDTDPTRIAVLSPDARGRTNPKRMHLDNKDRAEPHVGYIRLDGANLAQRLPADRNPDEDPRYELIHRLDRQVLVFDDGLDPAPIQADLKVPEFDQFAPDVELLPGLFDPKPPRELLARTILTGGTLVSDVTEEEWRLPSHLNSNPTAKMLEGNFASTVTWTRRVPGNSTTLRITDFAGNTEQEFFLGPVPGRDFVFIKVANLCAHNPLEWDDLPLREVEGEDKDFKWLYRLHQPTNGRTWKELLGTDPLPVPQRNEMPPVDTASNDCIPGGNRASF
jgi:hypothetical protein